jgi:hypothetical protein
MEIIMNPSNTLGALALLLAVSTGASASAKDWAAHHPRRAEVNARLANQNRRISAGVADGQLSHAQAHQLRADDHSIRTEERADASVDGSHITRGEQRQVNQQENANSRAIYDERHPQ